MRNGPKRDLLDVIYHCSECNFDFCVNCFRNYGNVHKHELEKTTLEKMIIYQPEYRLGYYCNGVKFEGCLSGDYSHNDKDEVLYHDKECSFDLCQQCFEEYEDT